MYYMCFACTNETYSLNSSGAEVIQHLRLIGQKLLVRVQSVFTLVKLLLLKCV